MAVQGIIGGVEIEGQMLRRMGMGGDELIDRRTPAIRIRVLRLDTILEAAKGRREASVSSSSGARPAANWRAGSGGEDGPGGH